MRKWQTLVAGTSALAIGIAIFVLLKEPSRVEPYKPGEAFKDCPECPEMVVVPAGEFVMGSPSSEEGRFDNEAPQRRVMISHPLAVGKYEVTVAEFSQFVRETGHAAASGCRHWTGTSWVFDPHRSWERPGFSQTSAGPVVCVTWNDAKAYADWLSEKTGRRYRLLTEAEWEYASRSGAASPRPWGTDLSRDDANYGADRCCQPYAQGRDRWEYTAPVGGFAPNRFGLYDMMGNVWEWVSDCWNKNYAGAPTDGSSWQSGKCAKRVIRGASWYSNPERVRSAVRYAFDKRVNRTKVGLRVGRDL